MSEGDQNRLDNGETGPREERESLRDNPIDASNAEIGAEPGPEWLKDPRVAYSQISGKWILEDDDGNEFEYDGRLKKWILVPDEEAIKQQQLAYVKEPEVPSEDSERPRKRQKTKESSEQSEELEQDENVKDRQGEQKEENNGSNAENEKVRPPTGIYLTNLPLDTSESELEQIFSRFGVIAEDLKNGGKRIKMYRDEDGNLKGDALIVYFKPESVPLAIEMMDDTRLRYRDEANIRVQVAQYTHPKENDDRPKLSQKEKLRLQKKIQKMNE